MVVQPKRTKIYVVVRTDIDIASDVKISAGGGEIGTVTLESAHYSQQEANHWASVYYEETRLNISEEDSNDMDSADLNEYMEACFSWDVKEVVLKG